MHVWNSVKNNRAREVEERIRMLPSLDIEVLEGVPGILGEEGLLLLASKLNIPPEDLEGNGFSLLLGGSRASLWV